MQIYIFHRIGSEESRRSSKHTTVRDLKLIQTLVLHAPSSFLASQCPLSHQYCSLRHPGFFFGRQFGATLPGSLFVLRLQLCCTSCITTSSHSRMLEILFQAFHLLLLSFDYRLVRQFHSFSLFMLLAPLLSVLQILSTRFCATGLSPRDHTSPKGFWTEHWLASP